MTDHDAILRAIIEKPDDHDLRLVYADWLKENGSTEGDVARAEFIRVQVEVWRDSRSDPAEEPERWRRADELRRRHQDEWLRPLGVGVKQVTFEAGFVQGAEMATSQFLRLGPRLTALTPLRRVKLTGAAGRVRRLAASRCLARIVALTLPDAPVLHPPRAAGKAKKPRAG